MRERLIALVDRILVLDAALSAAPGAPSALRGSVRSRPGPPTSEQALTALESAHGPLPVAYRAFLALHDGWEGFPSHRGRARLFSGAEFSSAETADFVARFRTARGNQSNREIQTSFVIGGVVGEAYVLLAPPTKKKAKPARWPDVVRTYGWAPHPSQGDAADFVAFLDRRVVLLSMWLRDAHAGAPVRNEADAWACVDEAITAFNDPEDNGERSDAADHTLQALAARLDAGSPAIPRALVALLAREIGRGRYVCARRLGPGIELLESSTRRWMPGAP